MKAFTITKTVSVLLAVCLAGVSAGMETVQAATVCEKAFLCLPGESCSEAKALYARAQQGDPVAEFAFGLRLMMGDGVMPDETAAMQWFEKAAKQGNVPAQLALGAFLTRPDSDEKSVQAGLSWLETAAKGGDWMASLQLSMLFLKGGKAGGEPDEKAAAKWLEQATQQLDALRFQLMERTVAPYRETWLGQAGEKGHAQAVDRVLRAADGGDPVAQTLAGVWLLSGSMENAGMAQDEKAGMRRLARAAKAGDRLASAVLGAIVLGEDDLYGREVTATVRHWLKTAAEQGDGECMALYGLFWLKGIGGAADEKEALVWLDKAAGKAVPEAMVSLAWVLQKQENRNEAARWLARAARVPDRPDLFSTLAWQYGSGEGPVAGEPEKVTEIRRYAEKGDPLAMLTLGLMYDAGSFGRRSLCRAIMWYGKVAEKGFAEGYLPLAMTCAEAGDTVCARKWLDAAVASETAMDSSENFVLAFGGSSDWQDRIGKEGVDEKATGRAGTIAKRFKWLQREEQRGNAAAAAVLARLYEAGIGVAPDEKAARKREKPGQRGRATP